jgi:tetratricopeptide (TPR) repeat protein
MSTPPSSHPQTWRPPSYTGIRVLITRLFRSASPRGKHASPPSPSSRLVGMIVAALVAPLFLPLFHIVGIVVLQTWREPTITQLLLSSFQKAMIIQFLIVVAAILYAVLIVVDRSYLPRLTKGHDRFLVLGALLVFTGVTSLSPAASFFGNAQRPDGLLYLIHIGAYIFMLSWVIRTRSTYERILSTTFWSGILMLGVASLIPIMRPAFRSPEIFRLVLETTLGNLNFLAHYLLILLVINAYFLQRSPKKWRYWVTTFIIGSALLLLTSSTAVIIGAVVILIMLWRQSKWVAYYSAIAVLIVTLVFVTQGHMDFFLTRITSLQDSWTIRAQAWGDAMGTIITNRPLLGYGWGNGTLLWNDAIRDVFAETYSPYHQSVYDKMHNAAIEYLVAAGIVGFSAFFLIWGWFISTARKRVRESKDPLMIFFVTAFLVEGIYILWNFDTPLTYVIMGVVLAGFLRFGLEQPAGTPWKRKDVLITGAVVIIVSATVLVNYTLPGYRAYTQRGVAESLFIANQDLRDDVWRFRYLEAIDRSLSIDQPYTLLYESIATTLVKYFNAGSVSQEESDNVYRRLDAIYRTLGDLYPLDPRYPQFIGHYASATAKHPAMAATELERAVALSPKNGTFRLKLATIYLKLGLDDRAYAVLDELENEGAFQGSVAIFKATIDLRAGQFDRAQRRVSRALAGYEPEFFEWNALIDSYLLHEEQEVVLAWTLRMLGLSGPKSSAHLARRAVELTRSLEREDRGEIEKEIQDWLRRHGFIIRESDNGVEVIRS